MRIFVFQSKLNEMTFLTKTDFDHVSFFPGVSLKCLSKKGSLLQKIGEVLVLIFEQIWFPSLGIETKVKSVPRFRKKINRFQFLRDKSSFWRNQISWWKRDPRFLEKDERALRDWWHFKSSKFQKCNKKIVVGKIFEKIYVKLFFLSKNLNNEWFFKILENKLNLYAVGRNRWVYFVWMHYLVWMFY